MSSLHSSGRCWHPRASRRQGTSRTGPSTCARPCGSTRSPSASRRVGTSIRDRGPGQHRGGGGVSRGYRFLAPSTAISILDKTRSKPWGINGGGEGDSNHIAQNPSAANEIVKGGSFNTPGEGEVLVNNTGGDGGWGDHPYRRDPEIVDRAVRSGFVPLEAARDCYGLVVDPRTSAVDGEATSELRKEKR